MKPILVTFDDVGAVSRFVDAIFNMPNGRGVTIHLASKEIEEFAEKYLAKKKSVTIGSDYDKGRDPMGYFNN